MIALILRTALLTAALVGGVTGSARANGAEQDTTNGVVPVKEAAAPVTEADKSAVPPGAPVPSVKATTDTAVASAPPPAPANGAQHYCDNIAAVAAEARFAWQTRKLNDLQAQVSQRVAELEKKQAELQASLNRRDEAMKQAQATLVGIYAKMQPDAAAAQLALLEDTTAAAILAQLNARQSSAILNEIKPERASQLVAAMTSLPKPTDKADGKKS